MIIMDISAISAVNVKNGVNEDSFSGLMYTVH